jgi:hypothetical protein
VTVAADNLAGPVTARWFDPATGRYRAIAGSPFPATGTLAFTPPANRTDGSSDWVLVLTAA